ncbi:MULTISPECIES: GNAT family N-acetyltransferase [unclassified Rhizobium]|uniref:GNAT family N-acetyltransferase n=1 Tax=unclassified Rhizobium TaxID=2613769 RepID=UPI0017849789|nr:MULTISPECIES: GNAT family N-acetyltransferase [unclassified Rhizobium]MBD8687317.1 GNAT family N-acetyltransferase [Rhizobium sp. CFBP 13644]MBD8691771.1 GNAT family N-acetyltransferase [Rhizobium sp. CFBP 13717]
MTNDHSAQLPDSSDISLSRLEARHLEGALKLSQEFSWPYRLEDWQFAANLGEGLVLERAGEVVGTALWWNYGAEHATAGMIIVTAKVQGTGQGSRLFNALLDATQGRIILLNATAEGLPLYERRGFTPWGKIQQHQAVLTVAPEIAPHSQIRPATENDLDSIIAFDERAIGMNRERVVTALADIGDTLVIAQGETLLGYAIARKFGRGHVIGPVAANNTDDAKHLIRAHLAKLGGQFVRMDVYAEDGLSPFLQSFGLPLVSEVVSMVRGDLPRPVAPAHMYAVSNQSLS